MSVDYDRDAGEYAQHRGTQPGVVAALIGVAAGRVLEVGCGTGNYLTALSAETGAELYGVDPSEAMLAHAGSRVPGAHLRQAAAECLPFPDTTFDMVYSVDVIHHVTDIPAHFGEVSRVLRPGGRFCIVTDSEQDIRARRPLSNYFPETIPIELRRYPSIGRLHNELSASGLRVRPVGHARRTYRLASAEAFRDRAFSSLHLLPEDVFRRRLAGLESALAAGDIEACSVYTLVWAQKPSDGYRAMATH